MKWDQLSARSRRWLSVGGVSAGVLLCSWMVASGLFRRLPARQRAKRINESILTDADTQQTTIDRLAAQLDSSRSENADLARKLDELSERQQRLPDTVANQLRRSLDREAATQDRELAGRLQQLEVQLERLQSRPRRPRTERRRKPTDLSTVVDRSDKPKRDAEAGDEPVVAAATPGIEFPDAGKTFDPIKSPRRSFRSRGRRPLTGGQPDGAPAATVRMQGAERPGAGDSLRLQERCGCRDRRQHSHPADRREPVQAAGDVHSDRHADHRFGCADRSAGAGRAAAGSASSEERSHPAEPLQGGCARVLCPSGRLWRSVIGAGAHARRDHVLRPQ